MSYTNVLLQSKALIVFMLKIKRSIYIETDFVTLYNDAQESGRFRDVGTFTK